MMIPDILGIINNWIAAKHFYKKCAEDLAEAKKELKEFVYETINNAVEPLLKNAPPEQKENIISTVQNSTEAITDAIVYTYEVAIQYPLTMSGSAETSFTPNVEGTALEPPLTGGPGPEDDEDSLKY